MRRIFALADFHGNLPALEAALYDMYSNYQPKLEYDLGRLFPGGRLLKNLLGISSARDKYEPDMLYYLGDAIGYGPFPNEVMDSIWAVAGKNRICIGNHELGVYDKIMEKSGRDRRSEFNFNMQAQYAINWTSSRLSKKNRKRLIELVESERYVVRDGNCIFSHGNPAMSKYMDRNYVLSKQSAEYYFGEGSSSRSVAFMGHTHIPQLYQKGPDEDECNGGRVLFFLKEAKDRFDYHKDDIERGVSHDYVCLQEEQDVPGRMRIRLGEGSALVVVPGGGQPRDGCPYTGYVLYEEDGKGERSVTFVRVSYAVQTIQDRMRKEGFPAKLIDRLEDEGNG